MQGEATVPFSGRGDHQAPANIEEPDDPNSGDEARPEAPRRSPLERLCLITLTLLAVVWTMYFTKAIALPITIGLVLNLILKPVVLRLRTLGLPEAVGAAIVLAVFGAIVWATCAALWAPATSWLQNSRGYAAEVREKLDSATISFASLKAAKEQVDEITDLGGEKEAEKVVVQQPGLSDALLNSTSQFLSGALVTVVLLYFLLASGDCFMGKFVEIMPTWKDKREVVLICREVQQQLSRYLGAVTLINIGLGLTISAGMWAIGMPTPLLWGVMAALLNYIPFAGFAAGTCIVFFAALVSLDSFGSALLAPAIYAAANGVEANFITPSLVGKSISLNPVVIVLAVFLLGWVWGIGGALLAVPIVLAVKIFASHYEPLNSLVVFLDS